MGIMTFRAHKAKMLYKQAPEIRDTINHRIEYVLDLLGTDTMSLEYATNSLYLMAQAEQENNLKFINIHFDNFQSNSDIAIDYCKYINEEVTSELMEIQSAIKDYYLRNYYE